LSAFQLTTVRLTPGWRFARGLTGRSFDRCREVTNHTSLLTS
jgi:hypothetical protein